MMAQRLSRDLDLARDAYRKRDRRMSQVAHSVLGESGHAMKPTQIGSDAMYAAFEGLVISGSVMTGLSYLPLQTSQYICAVLGIVFSLCIGCSLRYFIRHRVEHMYYEREHEREIWEMENYAQGEKKEMVELYESMGLAKDDAETIIETYAKYEKQFVDLMMLQELNITQPEGDPKLTAFVVLVFSMCGGFLPLFAYVCSLYLVTQENQAALTIGLSTLIACTTMFVYRESSYLQPLSTKVLVLLTIVLVLLCSHTIAYII